MPYFCASVVLTKIVDEALPDRILLIVELERPKSFDKNDKELPNLRNRKVVALLPILGFVRGRVGDVRGSVGQWSLTLIGRNTYSKIVISVFNASNMCDVLVASATQAYQQCPPFSIVRRNIQDVSNGVGTLEGGNNPFQIGHSVKRIEGFHIRYRNVFCTPDVL